MTERIIKNCGEDKVLYARLQALADLLNCLALSNGKNSHYYVDDTYLDFGQDWMWTTIIRDGSSWGSVQVLNPRQWGVLMDLTMNPADAVLKAYELVINGNYFSL